MSTQIKGTPTNAANEAVVLDATGKLPAVDGSQLTNLPIPTTVTAFNTRSGAVTLTSGDVTTALGFTPPNSLIVASGDVGSYRMAVLAVTATIADGGTVAGSSLRFVYGNSTTLAGAQSITGNGASFAGTWANVSGGPITTTTGSAYGSGLFQRIA